MSIISLLFSSAAGESSERAVFYNPAGGTYYHLDNTCPTMSEEVQQKLSTAPYTDLLTTLCALLPCEECAPAETRDYWFGEAEYRAAWPELETALYARALQPLFPCGWTINSSKTELALYVLFRDGGNAYCHMTLADDEWSLQQIDWMPILNILSR